MSKSTEEHIDAKIRRILKSETLLSDLTFRFACESFPDFPAYIASVMTGDEISVRDVRVQQRLMNPGGRDIVTDVMVYGEDGSVYDAEPNTYAEGSLIERGISHTYLVGSRLLKSGEEWRALRRGAVIMLNRHDVFGKEEAVIKVEPCIISGGKKELYGKGMCLYMVHVSDRGEMGVERDDLLRDLFVGYCQEEMSLPMTKKVVDYILEEGVQESMYEYIKEYFAQELAEGRAEARAEAHAEGRAEGRAEGAKEATISNARAMLAGGIPSDRVADILKLSESDMKEVMNMR